MSARFWAHYGFRRRVRLLLLACCVSALAVATLGSFVFQLYSRQDGLHHKNAMLAQWLAGQVSAAVAFRDHETATTMLSSLAIDDDILGATITTRNGAKFTSYTAPQKERPWFSHPHVVVRDIVVDREVLGQLTIETDDGSALVDLARVYLGISALVSAIAIAVALILGQRLGQRLLSPINHLVTVARSISEQGDSSLRAQPTGNPDVDELVRALNQMLERIQWQERELQGARDRLAQQVVALEHEIQQRRRIQEERLVIERKMQDSQRLESLGVLAGGVAHDFNNLLAAILGNANLAQMRLPSNSPVQRHIKQIEVISTRAAELCRQMLAYAGRGPLALEPVSIDQLVRETAELLRVSIGQDCDLEIDTGPDLPLVLGDGSQLRQIVLNLVVNASEAIGESRLGTIQVAVGVRDFEAPEFADARVGRELDPGNYIFIRVHDNGPGMAPEVVDRIFEPFFTTKFTGRGLGLAATLGIIRRHEGALFVESKVGLGSQFTVVLPHTGHALETSLTQHPTLAATWRGSGRVLVVDDEEGARQAETEFVEELGFVATSASSGEEALRIFNAASADFVAVVVDYLMPRMDGVELAGLLQQRHPNLPILLLSGFAGSSAITDLPPKLQNNFLAKPFTFRAFAAALRKAIDAENDPANA